MPLPFGGTEQWAVFVFEAGTLLLFVAYLFAIKKKRGATERETPPREQEKTDVQDDRKNHFPLFPKILLAVFFGFSVFQLIPLPQPFLKVFSPRLFEIYKGSISAGLTELADKTWHSVSFSPVLSVFELVKLICYGLFAWLVFKCVRRKEQIEVFVWVMMAGAVFQAFYGLAEYFSGTNTIFGFKNRWYVGSATGTFINRNHFSAFLEMVFALCVGYLLAKADFFSLKKGIPLKQKILWFGQERLQKAIIFGLISILIGVGIFFSRSRGGILSFFGAFFLMIISLSVTGVDKKERISREKRFARIVRTVTLIIIFSVLLIGIKPILERFSLEVLEAEGRPILYKNTIELIKDYPLSGTGLGTYIHAYTKYEQKYVRGITDHAHNDYLEVLAESGLVGGGCLIAAAFGALGWLFVKWGRRRDYFVKGIGLGCLAGIAAILIHSLSDFSMRMPANAVYFVSLYALAARTVMKMKDQGHEDKDKTAAWKWGSVFVRHR
jgi:O-antigen ligase